MLRADCDLFYKNHCVGFRENNSPHEQGQVVRFTWKLYAAGINPELRELKSSIDRARIVDWVAFEVYSSVTNPIARGYWFKFNANRRVQFSRPGL